MDDISISVLVAIPTPTTTDSVCDGLCVTKASTSEPQRWHLWGLHKGHRDIHVDQQLLYYHPSEGPKMKSGGRSATLHDSLAEDASKWARALESGEFSSRLSAMTVALILSQTLCQCWTTPSGGGSLWPSNHRASASSLDDLPAVLPYLHITKLMEQHRQSRRTGTTLGKTPGQPSTFSTY